MLDFGVTLSIVKTEIKETFSYSSVDTVENSISSTVSFSPTGEVTLSSAHTTAAPTTNVHTDKQ